MLTRRNPQRSLSSILGVGKTPKNSEIVQVSTNSNTPNKLDISLSSSNHSESNSEDNNSPNISNSIKSSKPISFKNKSQNSNYKPPIKSERYDESLFSASMHSSSNEENNDKTLVVPQQVDNSSQQIKLKNNTNVTEHVMVSTAEIKPLKKQSYISNSLQKDFKNGKRFSNASHKGSLIIDKSHETFNSFSDMKHTKEKNDSPKPPVTNKNQQLEKEEALPIAFEKLFNDLSLKIDVIASEFKSLRSEVNEQLAHLNTKLDQLSDCKLNGTHNLPKDLNGKMRSNDKGKDDEFDDFKYGKKNPTETSYIIPKAKESSNIANQNLTERMDKLEKLFSTYCNMTKGSKKYRKSTSTDDSYSMGYHSSRRGETKAMGRIPRDSDNLQFKHLSSRARIRRTPYAGTEDEGYINFLTLPIAPLRGPNSFEDINQRLKTFQNRFTQEAAHLGHILDKAISTHPGDLGSLHFSPQNYAPRATTEFTTHRGKSAKSDGLKMKVPLQVPQLTLGPGNNLLMAHTTLAD